MCTDLRLVRLKDLHVSASTLDFAYELGSRVRVVPAGLEWSATATGTPVDELRWTNAHGYVAMDAFATVQMWNAQVRRLWPDDRTMPDVVKPLLDFAFPMHLAVRDAHGGDLVVELLQGAPVFHDNPVGVLTNSPT